MVFKGYGELRKFFDEHKNYKIDFLSDLVYEFIFVFGILFVLNSTQALTTISMIYVLIWYIIQTVLGEMVYSLEFEIRSNSIINLISSRTDILLIYFKRSIVWILKAIIIFFLCLAFFINKIEILDISFFNIIMPVIISFTFMYIIYYSLLGLTLIFERVSTFTNLFTTVFLILGVKLPLIKKIFDLLTGKSINYIPIIIEIIVFSSLSIFIIRLARNKVSTQGF